MIKIYVVVFAFICLQNLSAQDKFLTKEGFVSFFSHSIVEDIEADNNQVVSVIDTTSGKVAVQLLMRSFVFEKALMREHFNENYVESYKFPKAVFKGKLQSLDDINEGNTITELVGVLELHGEEKEISTKVTINYTAEGISLSGDFNVEVADFKIKIPSIVRNNIAKTIKVSFELHHKPYTKM